MLHPLRKARTQYGVDSKMLLHRICTGIAFESLVEDVVRNYYGFNPNYVTLEVEDETATIHVAEGTRLFHYTDHNLASWAREFIAGEVFGIDPSEVSEIYIDGDVAENSPFLCIASSTQLISSGLPSQHKPLL